MTPPPPRSCDTFVALPPCTKSDKVIFGKNSDRPQNEVQEVVYFKGGIRPPKLKCTYITIDESDAPINSVILSKPAWMWGAEMGANDKNVAIGNEAVWTNYVVEDGDAKVKRLLGMDLVRLGLERGNSAEEALHIITSLLERYGQGGPCAENDDDLHYHSSFLIADFKEAWVLETSGNFWVAEKITKGYRNISNKITIHTKFDLHCENLYDKTKERGMWDGETAFNFAEIFEAGGDSLRQIEGERLLQNECHLREFDVQSMMLILREKETLICRDCNDSFPTMGSQVSCLSTTISSHFFTATPDTSMSTFKPFIFTPNVEISEYTVSPIDEPLREHYLYWVHKTKIIEKNDMKKHDIQVRREQGRVIVVEDGIIRVELGISDLSIFDRLMKECVEAELEAYLAEEDTMFTI